MNDHPLSFHWKVVDPGIFDRLGLPAAKSRDEQQARLSILTEAYLVGRADPGGWISYSRSKSWYSEAPRYRGSAYTFTTVTRGVDLLETVGLIEHRKAPPGTYRRDRIQSTFKASPALMGALGGAPMAVVLDPAETVVLRDEDGNSKDYRDTESTRRVRRKLAEINEAVGSAAIAHPELGLVSDGTPVALGNTRPGPAKRTMHRVFTGSFSQHGRFYGPWWQNIPKGERTRLSLNGEPLFEADYPRLHITLVYAEAGVPLEGDPYEVGSWPRSLVKMAVNIILNAKGRTSALRAVAYAIGGTGAFDSARLLLEDIERRHAPVKGWFYSNAGLRLMHTDSKMAEGVLLSLIKKGVVALPLHDSFMVESRHSDHLFEAMAAQLEGVVGSPTSHCTHNGNSPTGLHMVPPPVPVVVVVLPVAGRQGDLFPAPSPGLPASDVFGWSGGVAPASVRRALRREIRRRGHRQADVAGMVGLSRPQLVNILQGRFGASAPVADRIRHFLLEEAVTVKAQPRVGDDVELR